MVICAFVHDGEMLGIQAAEVWSETCINEALILDPKNVFNFISPLVYVCPCHVIRYFRDNRCFHRKISRINNNFRIVF